MNQSERLPDFLAHMLNKQYGEEITQKIVHGFTMDRKVTFRINTIKTDINSIENKLRNLKIEYEKVAWSPEAIILKKAQERDIQELEFYKKGEIYLQSLSSMLPPIILNPQPDTDILDMTAAPGGKTTQIASLTQNKAHITACEINSIRSKRLQYNIQKQGATGVHIMISDSRKIDDFFSFDNILLDAPCSGSGTLHINDANVKRNFTMQLIEKSVKSQLCLLQKAMRILKSGQEMVYSTCSILCQENEEIVSQILKETKAQIVPIALKGMEKMPLLPSSIKGTLCICPNELYEGFFVAKIKKI